MTELEERIGRWRSVAAEISNAGYDLDGEKSAICFDASAAVVRAAYAVAEAHHVTLKPNYAESCWDG